MLTGLMIQNFNTQEMGVSVEGGGLIPQVSLVLVMTLKAQTVEVVLGLWICGE